MKLVSTTTKKVKVIGSETYVNSRTGEVKEFEVIELKKSDFNFQKIWMCHILSAIDEMSSAKLKILMFIINESSSNQNVLPFSIKEIADKTSTSYATVIRTLKVLEKYDIIKRKVARVMVNPNVVFKGKNPARMAVIIEYKKFD